MAEMVQAAVQEVLKKLAPDMVFPEPSDHVWTDQMVTEDLENQNPPPTLITSWT